MALEAWMAANTRYSLDIPTTPPGADAVEQFLFVDKVGFCEQIGSSLVVMLRSLGIPARLAVGYAPGQRNPFTGLYEVRASDAHAWAEVYIAGVGWHGFDPTAEVPLAGDAGLRSAGSGLAAFLAGRLPSLPSRTLEVLIGVAGIALLATGLGRWVKHRSRAKRKALEVWPHRWMVALETAGIELGRPRRSGETIRAYVDVLRRGPLPHPRWRSAINTVEWESFSGGPATQAARDDADTVLAEALSAGSHLG